MGEQRTILTLNLKWAKSSHVHCCQGVGLGPWLGTDALQSQDLLL